MCLFSQTTSIRTMTPDPKNFAELRFNASMSGQELTTRDALVDVLWNMKQSSPGRENREKSTKKRANEDDEERGNPHAEVSVCAASRTAIKSWCWTRRRHYATKKASGIRKNGKIWVNICKDDILTEVVLPLSCRRTVAVTV